MSLAGKTIVFTGTLSLMTRAEAKAKAEAAGAKVTAAISGNTDIAVAGAGAGSKLEDAKARGVDVWTEKEFMSRLGDAGDAAGDAAGDDDDHDSGDDGDDGDDGDNDVKRVRVVFGISFRDLDGEDEEEVAKYMSHELVAVAKKLKTDKETGLFVNIPKEWRDQLGERFDDAMEMLGENAGWDGTEEDFDPNHHECLRGVVNNMLLERKTWKKTPFGYAKILHLNKAQRKSLDGEHCDGCLSADGDTDVLGCYALALDWNVDYDY